MWYMYTMVQPYHGMLRGITITQNAWYSLLRSVSSIATIVGLCIQQACGGGTSAQLGYTVPFKLDVMKKI